MASWWKNHALEVGVVMFGVGLVLAVLSYGYTFGDAPGWLGWYEDILDGIPGADATGYNLVVLIVGTVLLVSGAWSAGEQIVLRRRFERLIDTPKKSEFVSNRKSLDKLSRRLPDEYRSRVKAKEVEMRSAR